MAFVLCGQCAAGTVTWLWEDFNGSYPGAFNGFIEENWKAGDMFATHYYDANSHSLPPHAGRDASQAFYYYKSQTDNAFVTYIETKSSTDPDKYVVDLVALLASRGQDPIDLAQPITYRIHVYGHNDAVNPNDPKAYWRQKFEVQRPTNKSAEISWTGANNDTWQVLEVTNTGLDSNRYQWITLDSWYPGLDSEVDSDNYGNMIKNTSFMCWENLEIEYTPVPPVFQNLIVVSDPPDTAGYCHVENEERTLGMRVHLSSNALSPRKGDRISLWGSYERTTPEKIFWASTVKIVSSGNALPGPYAMNMRSVGGKGYVAASQGPGNVGLLMRLSGRVTYTGAGFFYIDDGSKLPYASTYGTVGMKVVSPKGGMVVGQYVTVTGMLGMELGSNAPLFRVRNDSDVRIIAQ